MVVVTDKDLGSGSNATTHGVTNVAPTVATPTVTPEPSAEGSSATASASFSDPAGPAAPTFTFTCDYGGLPTAAAGTVSGPRRSGPRHTHPPDHPPHLT